MAASTADAEPGVNGANATSGMCRFFKGVVKGWVHGKHTHTFCHTPKPGHTGRGTAAHVIAPLPVFSTKDVWFFFPKNKKLNL